MVQASVLSDRSVIAVGGAEARSFLQGLISNDMENCAPGRAIYSALLTPQGKVLYEFLITESEGRFLLDCATARAAELVKRLIFYRLRAKIDIAPADLAVAAAWDNEPAIYSDVVVFPDPRLPALGLRMIATRPQLQRIVDEAEAGDYQAHRLRLGVPDSADLPPDTVFALDAGFEELGGVDFKKGCYVGQEVTARMKHRASARRRFLIAEFEGELPPPGTKLEAAGRDLGNFATGMQGHALALVRLDRLEEAREAGAPITAAGRLVNLQKPSWLQV
jgi:tRNA-modifying protein YgfZ